MKVDRLRNQTSEEPQPIHRLGFPKALKQRVTLRTPIPKPSIRNASAQALSILSAEEIRDLVAYEEVIAKGWDTFIEVGRALTQIRDKRLYRADFETFDEYCRDKWHYAKSQAYRLIGAAEVIQLLLPMPNVPMPRNESQVRPLLGLNPDQVKVVWRDAVQKAGAENVTAKLVKQMAARFRATPTNDKAASTASRPSTTVFKAGKLLHQAGRSLRSGDIATTLRLLDELRKLLSL